MAFTLPLPKKLANQWSVKIRDRERLEPRLQQEWDEMYPENKVQSEEVEVDD